MRQLLLWQHGNVTCDWSSEILHHVLQDHDAHVWLDVQGEDIEQMSEMLRHDFGLSQLTLDTIAEEKERARLVEQHNYFYLVVHGLVFDSETDTADTPKLDIAFGKNFLVTVHKTPLPWLDMLIQTATKDASTENMMRHGTPRLLHAILDTMVDSYFPVLEDLDDVVDELENETVQVASKEVQGRLFRLKRALAQMRRVISPQIEVMNALINRTGDFIPTDAEPYFADVHDHLIRTFEVLDSYRDLMSGLLDVYLTTVSNRLNEVMKQLAIISTIFLPITFVTGVFGQNFAHSPQVEHDAGYNFWIVMAFMFVITLAQLAYFRYRKWL